MAIFYFFKKAAVFSFLQFRNSDWRQQCCLSIQIKQKEKEEISTMFIKAATKL